MTPTDDLMNGRRHQFVEQMIRHIGSSSACASILSIEIGGSVGRNEADVHSDVDVFIYVAKGAIEEFESNLVANIIEPLGSPIIIEGPVHKPRFGTVYTVDYKTTGLVSFILRKEENIRPNFMRAAASIVYDPQGKLSSVSAAVSKTPAVPRTDLARQAVATSYIRLLNVGKEVARKNGWQARKYYREVLEQILILERIITNIEPRGRNYRQPGRGMERDLPPIFVEQITSLEAMSNHLITETTISRTIELLHDLHSQLQLDITEIDWESLSNRVIECINKSGEAER